MRRLIIIAALALSALVAPGVALADTGQYTTSDGPSCNWYGQGTLYMVSCSGYSRSSGQFTSYNCDVTIFSSMTSWNCRSMMDGATWSGSR